MADVHGAGTAVMKRPEKRVLILASGPTAAQAPIEEARASGSEIWGLNAVHRQVDPWLFTRFFQIHKSGTGEGHIDDPDHAAWLKAWGTPAYSKWVKDWGHVSGITSTNGHKEHAPIYMIDETDAIPSSLKYPIEEVSKDIGPMGRKYFTSSIDFMFALAICERFTEIDLYGIDLISDGDREYTRMRQSAEYYIGVMQGRGIKYFIPQSSALCRTDRIYGYEEKPKHDENLVRLIKGLTKEITAEMDKADEERVKATAELNACKGGRKALESIVKLIELRDRGSQF